MKSFGFLFHLWSFFDDGSNEHEKAFKNEKQERDMEKGYKRTLGTKAMYIGGIALIIGGSVAWSKGIQDAPYYIAVGAVMDGLAYLHERWERKQYHKGNLRKYAKD